MTSPKFINFPSVKSVGLSKLEDTVENRGYGASQLTDALARFIVQFREPDYTPIQVEEYA
ncbi:hypothetical protein K435DRAFT_881534 [Dendrothele bispora CBS 962.96]|uniref:Uncharacterized protein n=1 Tax=Dendrothele bispora (strain CBS 962.96) TaxID=1314807 RepID=A0A4S8KIA1_DENBC|nr:hypothetical protein K435DRAFT_881534 [Dendrothele bispora CBS 962.96]